jgi:tetratricopeptide (TPR) repeat protein
MSQKKDKHIRDILKEKDVFLTTSEKIYEFTLRHTRALACGLGAVVLVVVAGFAYVRGQEAAEAASLAAYERALALASPVAALEKVRADYPGRQAARLAALALLRLHAEAGAPEQALPLAESLLKSLKPAEISLKPVLLDNIGGLYEAVRDYPRAAQSYQALLDWPSLPDSFKSNTLLALGRAQDAAGQPQEAARAYEDLLQSFPGSYPALLARARLSTLKGEAVAPLAAPPLVLVGADLGGPAETEAGAQNE